MLFVLLELVVHVFRLNGAGRTTGMTEIVVGYGRDHCASHERFLLNAAKTTASPFEVDTSAVVRQSHGLATPLPRRSQRACYPDLATTNSTKGTFIMALTVVAVTGTGATGPALAGNLANRHSEVSNAIGQLKANQIFGGHPATMIANVFEWRVDRQTPPPNNVNISVQRNNVGAPSTVASVFVPTALNVRFEHPATF